MSERRQGERWDVEAVKGDRVNELVEQESDARKERDEWLVSPGNELCCVELVLCIMLGRRFSAMDGGPIGP